MPPGNASLSIYQGDDWTLLATFTSGGSPVNLTGMTFAAEIRAGTADSAPSPLATITCAIVAPATDGKLLLSLSHDETLPLVPDPALLWDLQAQDSLGKVTTYLRGSVTITPEITRP
jgi:hypothetical protein